MREITSLSSGVISAWKNVETLLVDPGENHLSRRHRDSIN